MLCVWFPGQAGFRCAWCSTDARVGRQLFERCVCGLLGSKTRVLVTHQLQFMKDVQTIVVLAHGSIAGKGDFMVR